MYEMTYAALLTSLRPTKKDNIIDVVAQTGIDVTDWVASTRGNPNTNPKYCFEWVFADGSVTLFCLWFKHMRSDESGIYQTNTLWPDIKGYEATGNTKNAKSAGRLDREIQRAFVERKPVRVAIVDGRMRASVFDTKSVVEFRHLDSEPWFVASFDYENGTYVIRRGVQESADVASNLVDQKQQDSPPALFAEDGLAADLADLFDRGDLAPTSRRALVDARLGQGGFRKAVLGLWGKACAATGCSLSALLRASHIKPWRVASDAERLDPENGLPLTANLDALFDRGLIGFSDDGRLLVSPALALELREELHLPAKLRREPTSRQKIYLAHHRQQHFQEES
jgi:hypothetical protein